MSSYTRERLFKVSKMKKENNFIENLNILDGVIIYNDFDIDEEIPFEKQKYSYKEDILQIKFGDRFLLDVGGLPEFEPDGYFIAQAIQDQDWLEPLLKEKCRTIPDLKMIIEKAAKIINKKMKTKDLPYRDVQYEEWD